MEMRIFDKNGRAWLIGEDDRPEDDGSREVAELIERLKNRKPAPNPLREFYEVPAVDWRRHRT
jgi:hypothetical protein